MASDVILVAMNDSTTRHRGWTPARTGTALTVLPTFVVIGAAKAGTTSIHEYLSEHPQVFMPSIKPQFLAYDGPGSVGDYPVRDFAHYESLFTDTQGYAAIGDVSEACLNSTGAAGRIATTIPDARIIVVLRNPVERAFSGYMMQLRTGKQQVEAATAFREDANFVQGGFYFERLTRYFDRFPRERIQVHLFDDFSADTLGVMRQMFRFVGVDDTFRPGVEVRHNAGYSPRSKALSVFVARRDVRQVARRIVPRAVRPFVRRALRANQAAIPSMPVTLRAEMEELYREDVLRVEELIGRDLSRWIDRGFRGAG